MKKKTFEERVNYPDDPDGCHIWIGSINTSGYGRLRFNGKASEGAHRASWVINNGPIPDGMHVLHTCDVRRCVNPKHLWLGTNADNVRDKCEKGRHNCGKGDGHGLRLHPDRAPSGSRNGSITHPERLVRGAANHKTKLTEEGVKEIRRLHSVGGIGYYRLAKIYGVVPSTIREIVMRTTWMHVA